MDTFFVLWIPFRFKMHSFAHGRWTFYTGPQWNRLYAGPWKLLGYTDSLNPYVNIGIAIYHTERQIPFLIIFQQSIQQSSCVFSITCLESGIDEWIWNVSERIWNVYDAIWFFRTNFCAAVSSTVKVMGRIEATRQNNHNLQMLFQTKTRWFYICLYP